MKTNQTLKFICFAVVLLALTITSCNKATTANTNTTTTDPNGDESPADNSLVAGVESDVNSMSDEVGDGNTLTNYKNSGTEAVTAAPCASITIDTVSNPKVLTINFGTVNCLCIDNRYRRGKIIINFTGRYRDAGTVISKKFQNYAIDNNNVTGYIYTTNNGLNTQNQLTFSHTSSLTVIKPNGNYVSRTANTPYRWINGHTTLTKLDDKFAVSGTASGTRSAGSNTSYYTQQITSDLIRDLSSPICRKHFTQGVLNVTPNGLLTRVIDYGNGTCDNQATVTVGNVTYTITLY